MTLLFILFVLFCCLMLIHFLNSFSVFPTRVLWLSCLLFVHLMFNCPTHVLWFCCLVFIYFHSATLPRFHTPVAWYWYIFLCYRQTKALHLELLLDSINNYANNLLNQISQDSFAWFYDYVAWLLCILDSRVQTRFYVSCSEAKYGSLMCSM